eukprot:1151031-Pelagomonas_calceolata.AAC.3
MRVAGKCEAWARTSTSRQLMVMRDMAAEFEGASINPWESWWMERTHLQVPPEIRGRAGGWSGRGPTAGHGAQAGVAAPVLRSSPRVCVCVRAIVLNLELEKREDYPSPQG